MANDRVSEYKSIHQLAFSHYLRTGECLTNDEWTAKYERKFNPYHDELGRFTSPPGVTVSYGNSRRSNKPNSGSERRAASPRPNSLPRSMEGDPIHSADRIPEKPTPAAKIDDQREPFRSETVEAATVIQQGQADTYFELQRRQESLDAFRRSLGSRASPKELADMADIQKRLDQDRARLDDISRRVLDPETVEVLRALPHADTLAASINILRGEGDMRDTFSVVTSIPIAGQVGKLAKLAMARRSVGELAKTGKVIQLGGAYRDIKGLAGYEAHHAPGKAVSPLKNEDGPAIAMLKEDHRRLVSSKGGPDGIAFRKLQSDHIARGDFAAAMQADIDHIRSIFGDKYDDAIEQMLKHSRDEGII